MGWEQILVNLILSPQYLLIFTAFRGNLRGAFLVSSAYSTTTEIKLAEREAFMVN